MNQRTMFSLVSEVLNTTLFGMLRLFVRFCLSEVLSDGSFQIYFGLPYNLLCLVSNLNLGKRYPELSSLLRWATEAQTIDQFWNGCHLAQSLPHTLLIFDEFVESDERRHILIDLNDRFTVGL